MEEQQPDDIVTIDDIRMLIGDIQPGEPQLAGFDAGNYGIVCACHEGYMVCVPSIPRDGNDNREFTFSSDTIRSMAEAIGAQWPRPIPVSERLPSTSCLAYATSAGDPSDHCWVTGDLIFGETNWWCLPEDWVEPVTHWLPLPPDPLPPKPE